MFWDFQWRSRSIYTLHPDPDPHLNLQLNSYMRRWCLASRKSHQLAGGGARGGSQWEKQLFHCIKSCFCKYPTARTPKCGHLFRKCPSDPPEVFIRSLSTFLTVVVKKFPSMLSGWKISNAVECFCWLFFFIQMWNSERWPLLGGLCPPLSTETRLKQFELVLQGRGETA